MVRETGLMWANMLRAFQVGNALTSNGAPSSWMRPSRVAWAQVSWPACHLGTGLGEVEMRRPKRGSAAGVVTAAAGALA